MSCNLNTWTNIISGYTAIQGICMATANILIALGEKGIGPIANCTIANAFLICNNDTCQDIFIIEIVYAVLHILWLIASIIVLSQMCTKKKRFGDLVFWDVATACAILLDTVTGVLFAVNIPDDPDPEVIMTLISFRGVVFYILNLCAFLVIVRATLVTRKEAPSDTKTSEPAPKSIKDQNQIGGTQTLFKPELSVYGDSQLKSINQQEVMYATQNNAFEGDNTINVGARAMAPMPYSQNQQASPTYMELSSEDAQTMVQEPSQNSSLQYDLYQAQVHREDEPPPRWGPKPYMQPPSRSPMHNDEPRPYDLGPISEHEAYEDFEDMPPPRYPPRPGKPASSFNSRPPPSIPDADYSEQQPSPAPPVKSSPSKATPAGATKGFDPRPFSYLNPSFRPTDHLDVEKMKENKADIVKTLDEELKQMEAEAMVKAYLGESSKRVKPAGGSTDPIVFSSKAIKPAVERKEKTSRTQQKQRPEEYDNYDHYEEQEEEMGDYEDDIILTQV